jgi:hypothetical protein
MRSRRCLGGGRRVRAVDSRPVGFRALWILLSVGMIACAPPGPPATPSEAALRVFQIASEPHPAPETLDLLFAAGGDEGDAALSDDQRGALLDALEQLGEATALRVNTVEPLEGSSVTAVDLSGDLAGGGSADYSVHVTARADGSFGVIWLAGPGVDWPSRHRGRGTGLTTSTPPTGSSRP